MSPFVWGYGGLIIYYSNPAYDMGFRLYSVLYFQDSFSLGIAKSVLFSLVFSIVHLATAFCITNPYRLRGWEYQRPRSTWSWSKSNASPHVTDCRSLARSSRCIMTACACHVCAPGIFYAFCKCQSAKEAFHHRWIHDICDLTSALTFTLYVSQIE